MDEALSTGIAPLAALEDELPRRIYLFIRRGRRPVSREEIAAEVGISRRLAAFHLERLLERGLLKATYARPPGRSGPGAGRSAKYYEPSDLRVEVSLPGRRYDLAGRLLVSAIKSQTPGESAPVAARRAAREKGHDLGEEVRRERRLRPPGPERTLGVAEEVLEDLGFEPYREEADIVALRNCPFHDLAKEAPELMCDMNQAFIDGLLRGLGNDTVESVLSCKPGDCCVTLKAPKHARGSSPASEGERARTEPTTVTRAGRHLDVEQREDGRLG
jgi:predicted ArsR family transcriptional regulator